MTGVIKVVPITSADVNKVFEDLIGLGVYFEDEAVEILGVRND